MGDAHRRHGMDGTRFYKCWIGIKSRTRCKTDKDYHRYGGRGIEMCAKWNLFENFYKDMFPTYKDNLTIDRINVNGNYCKRNCKWSTPHEQNKNKTNSVKYLGETAADASIRLGARTKTLIQKRMDIGWSRKKAFTTPVRKYENI